MLKKQTKVLKAFYRKTIPHNDPKVQFDFITQILSIILKEPNERPTWQKANSRPGGCSPFEPTTTTTRRWKKS